MTFISSADSERLRSRSRSRSISKPSSSSNSQAYTKEYRSGRSATYHEISIFRDSVAVHNTGARAYDCHEPHPSYTSKTYDRINAYSPPQFRSRPKTIEYRRLKSHEPTFPSSSHSLTSSNSCQPSINQPQVPACEPQSQINLATNYSGASQVSSTRSSTKQNALLPTSPLASRRLPTCPTDDSTSLFDLSTTNTHVANVGLSDELDFTPVFNPEDALNHGSRAPVPATVSSSCKDTLSGSIDFDEILQLVRTLDIGQYRHAVDSLESLQDSLESPQRGAQQNIGAASCGSSVFDSSSQAGSEASTTYTAPSRRSTQPADVVNLILRYTPDSDDLILPCEFTMYSNCDRTFTLDKTEEWIEHNIAHLHGHLPMRCVCWFCDDFWFHADERGLDRLSNFQDRLDHIGRHIREEHLSLIQIRPDYFFLKHLREHDFISERLYMVAKSWEGESPAPTMDGIYDHEFVPLARLKARDRLQQVIVIQKSEDKRTKLRSRINGTVSLHNIKGTIKFSDDPKNQLGLGSTETLVKEENNGHSGTVQEVKAEHGEASRLDSLGKTSLVCPTDNVLFGATPTPEFRQINFDKSAVESKTDPVDKILPGCEQLSIVDLDHSPQSSRSSICLSRTSSSEDYPESAGIKQKKQQIVEKLIIYVTKLLRSQSSRAADSPGHWSAAATNESSSSTFHSSEPRFPPGNLTQSNTPGKASKKRKTTDGSGGEEASDDDFRQHEQSARKGKEKDQLRFACPYFKYDPTKYESWPNCCGPGWPSVHRVKLDSLPPAQQLSKLSGNREHLYRRHKQPKWRCMRCCRAFKLKEDLEAHARETTACLVQPPKPMDGFDESQETLLRSRKPAFTGLPEYDKWREVYKILFPLKEPNEIPSPFYDHNHNASDRPECSAQREAYLLQELPLRIKTAIESELGAALNIDEKIFRKAAKRCVSKILHDFTEKLTLSSTPTHLDTTIEGLTDQDFTLPEVNTEETMGIYGASSLTWSMDGAFFDSLPSSFMEIGEFEPRVGLEHTREIFQSPHNGERLGSDSGYGSNKSKGSGMRATGPK